ncbi:uncharacterized protein LOC134280140 [Saccostrea cucullata]|uniref:uncharacterized protein LOC134280140 n=1 Tax=Saccostrea cuccullata TaxID=36930 RepID=UPI002ED51C40
MMNLEIILILVLVCLNCHESKSIRSSSKAVGVNQKTSLYPRRCSGRKNIHRHDENTIKNQQSGSSESKENEEIDENNKAVQAIAVSTNEKRVNVIDTVSMVKPNEENLPMTTDNTDRTSPVPEEIGFTHSGADEICWDFEGDRCYDLMYSLVLDKGTKCKSDEDCEESIPGQSGKCCDLPCDHLTDYYTIPEKLCRYPVDNQDLKDSFSPAWTRDF